MDLVDALGLNRYTGGESPVIAFVGAGGKTTTLFQVAESLCTPVVISTTTHFGAWQISEPYSHIIVENDEHILDIAKRNLNDKPLVITRQLTGENKFRGIQTETVDRLREMYEGQGTFILIEADGARGISIKAPEKHEPALPSHVDEVVVVVGLDVLGKPISPKTVHRSDKLCDIVHAKPGDNITPEMILRLLLHHDGGLKNIPHVAMRSVLFTHVDTAEKLSVASTMADSLLGAYHRVVMTDLERGGTGNSARIVVRGYRGRVGGVVLAAGGSTRFGLPKQLLDWQGKPLVRHVVEVGLNAGLDPVVVVLGAERDKITKALHGLDVQLVWNSQWAMGQGASVQAGTKNIFRHVAGVVFLLSDQPFLDKNLLMSLREAYWRTKAAIIAPISGGKRANPVLFDEVTFNELASLSGEVGGKQLFAKYPVYRIPWLDERILLDVDTPEDYQRAKREMI